MRLVTGLLVLISVSLGQWVETTIPLPDSLSGLEGVGAIQFDARNHAMYVGGDGKLIVVDAATREKRAAVDLPGWIDMMCISTASNKLYCASRSAQSIHVVDCATNQYVKAVPLNGYPREMCYAAAENKVYFAIPSSNSVQVLDCASDSIVATLGSLPSASDVCYNPVLNRVYSAQSASDEVAVIDCTADTLIRTIWIRGVEPTGLCYDSATNCVYTANYTSATSSVIDCAGDSVVRIVAVGDKPWSLLAGPDGKVFCSGDGPTLTVIDGNGTRTLPVGDLYRWSYDPANRKIYHASWRAYSVTVVDAVGDSVLGQVNIDEATSALCYDPVGNGTWLGGEDGIAIRMVDGATEQVIAFVPVGAFHPGAMRYNPVNNCLYCLTAVWGSDRDHYYLMVIDGDSNRVRKMLPVEADGDSLLWNPTNNKLYLANHGNHTILILDCASDSIVATIDSRGEYPNIMCNSGDGKVYVVNEWEGITVIDPWGDSVRTVVPVGRNPWTVCCDFADNKVYVGMWNGDPVRVIDVDSDSVVDSIAVGFGYQSVSWNENHDKIYVSSLYDPQVAVIDCATDTSLKIMTTTSSGLGQAYCDSVSDKVYFADADDATIRILNPATDSLYKNLNAGAVGAMIDNGRPGSAHRLFSTGYPATGVAALSGTADSVLYLVRVGEEPSALAWNPVHSWVYVSNYLSADITVLRDTLLVGIEESKPQAASHKPQATMVHGILMFGSADGEGRRARGELLDISGRKVLDLHPGANDVRALAPGVYFVREELQAASHKPQAVRKVVITR